MMCDKDVCERWCVTKLGGGGGGGCGGGGGGRDGYRIKNKNPTQRCGEKRNVSCKSYISNRIHDVATSM